MDWWRGSGEQEKLTRDGPLAKSPAPLNCKYPEKTTFLYTAVYKRFLSNIYPYNNVVRKR